MNRPYQRYRFTIKPAPTFGDAIRSIICMVALLWIIQILSTIGAAP